MELHLHINIDDRIWNFFRKLFSRKYLPKLLFLGTLIPLALQAAPVTIPNTFIAGNPISAAEMNANFAAVKTAVDDNFNKLVSVKTTVDDNFNKLPAQKTYVTGGGGVTLPATSTGLFSITFTAPSNGYVLAIASGTVYLNVSASQQLVRIKLSTTPGDTAEDGYVAFIRNDSMPAGVSMHPFANNRIISVTAGSIYTIYLNYWHQLGSASCVSCAVDDTQMSVLFIPKLL